MSDTANPLPHIDMPDGQQQVLFLDTDGIKYDDHGDPTSATVCEECARFWRKNKLPPLSYANGTYVGAVPAQLHDLTFIEEFIIARCRAKCWIVHLKEDKNSEHAPVAASDQRGFKKHVIVYPQRPEALATVLPSSLEEILMPICIMFVGSSRPTKQWLEQKAKPLAVRRERIRAALLWLKEHNPFYSEVVIDEGAIQQLPHDGILPYEIQCIQPNEGQDALTSSTRRTCSLPNT